MASLNDFKLLCQKCEKYYKILENELNLTGQLEEQKKRERFGFYLYIIENICGIKDINDLVSAITDTEFNSLLFNNKDDDQGVDAVYIDFENSEIKLFNFKYRNEFSNDKKQSINETIISTKFINALKTEDVSHLKGKLKDYANQILKALKGNQVWSFELYVISNESIELNKNSSEIKQLESLYDLQIIPIGLTQIVDLMSIRPNPVDAVLILDKDAVLSFSESSISSSKSYVIRVPLTELIRVTCDDLRLRNDYNIEDWNELSDVGMDYNLLFDNVRGFIQKSKFNKNILRSLKETPSKFFMYNNGLTITANDIVAEEINAGKKIKLKIKNFQIVNGGQTLRTIHNFNQQEKDYIVKYLADGEILIRVFKTISDNNEINKIAEYTNSQNSISTIDLKSLSTEQIQIEQFLDEHNIIYARKSGDIGLSENKEYTHKISMERYGQVLFSLNGFPEKASNQKKQIFDKYYSDIFNEENFDINQSPIQISKYFDIKSCYESNNVYEVSDQKVFYILYMSQHLSDSIDVMINKLESLIKEYTTEDDKELSDARKLIQVRFKKFLDDELKING